jgi:hypothetical protein
VEKSVAEAAWVRAVNVGTLVPNPASSTAIVRSPVDAQLTV